MPTLNVPRFAPDLASYNPKYSSRVINMEPTADGWGPLPSFRVVGTGLPSECRGAITVIKSDGSRDVYAGTYTGLYKFNIGTAGFDDVTRLSGPYSMSQGDFWTFTQIEDINGSRLVATNGVDSPQFIDINVGVRFNVLPNAPIAKFCAAVGGFLVLGRLATDFAAVAWSAFRDTQSWNYGYGGSDLQPIPDGGEVKALVGSEGGAVIFQTNKIRSLSLTYDDVVFRMRVIHDNIGCFASYSVIQVGNTLFWYDQGGYYEGIEAKPIGDERVNAYVRRIANDDNLKLMQCGINPRNKMVWWLVQQANGQRVMIGYKWAIGEWTTSDVNVNYIFKAAAPGYTIDSLWTLLGYTMDDIPFSFDASFWSGSQIEVMAGFDASGNYGYFEGPNLQAVLETADLELNANGFTFLRSVAPITDADRSAITVEVATSEVVGGSFVWHTAEILNQYSGMAFPCKDSRIHKIRFTIAPTTWNNFNRMNLGVERSGTFE